jgi:hypothetical protein
MLIVFYDLDEGLAIPTLCFHQEYKYVWIVRPWVLSARNDDKCMLWLISPERITVGELPDEVGDTAISLQGLGEKALQCFLLF